MPVYSAGLQRRHIIDDESAVGEARRDAQRVAIAEGLSTTHVGEVAIVATELANNLWRHAGGGELLLQAVDHSIELLAIDRGCGMANVDRCLRDGFSTAGTAGQGLGAVGRLTSEFDLYSAIGIGTVIFARVGAVPAKRFGAICIPIKGETVCGDAWRIASEAGELAVCVVDGLGHGPLAAEASQLMADTFSSNPYDDPTALLQRSHARLSGTRGAAGAFAKRLIDGTVQYCGIGNISGCIVTGVVSQGMVSHNGIIGVQSRRPQQFNYMAGEEAVLVMHSDGVSARWSLAKYPGLQGRHPAVIAGVLFRDHARVRDDATVVVVDS
jgi:anti-sigma regulatory factor (Ser/Thr protein kinase)